MGLKKRMYGHSISYCAYHWIALVLLSNWVIKLIRTSGKVNLSSNYSFFLPHGHINFMVRSRLILSDDSCWFSDTNDLRASDTKANSGIIKYDICGVRLIRSDTNLETVWNPLRLTGNRLEQKNIYQWMRNDGHCYSFLTSNYFEYKEFQILWI